MTMNVLCLLSVVAIMSTNVVGDATCTPACKSPRTCVVQGDGNWAQCIDCNATVFNKECHYWGADLKIAAEKVCAETCGTVPTTIPPESTCTPACASPRTCVVQADGNWAQCVDCDAAVFNKECHYWGGAFKAAAEEECAETCGAVPTTLPPEGTCTPPCSSPRTCVVQADGNWAQCIDCNATVFNKECHYWGADLKAAAEEECAEKCGATPTTITPGTTCTLACAPPRTCVVQADGNWEQCIDCKASVFNAECPYWGSQLRIAAEEECSLTCTTSVV